MTSLVINKVLSSTDETTYKAANSISFVKDDKIVKAFVTDNDNTVSKQIGNSGEFPCLSGPTYVVKDQIVTYNITNFDTNTAYVIEATGGIINLDDINDGIIYFTSNIDSGMSTLTVNGRTVSIENITLPEVTVPVVTGVSGTLSSLESPFKINVTLPESLGKPITITRLVINLSDLNNNQITINPDNGNGTLDLFDMGTTVRELSEYMFPGNSYKLRINYILDCGGNPFLSTIVNVDITTKPILD